MSFIPPPPIVDPGPYQPPPVPPRKKKFVWFAIALICILICSSIGVATYKLGKSFSSGSFFGNVTYPPGTDQMSVQALPGGWKAYSFAEFPLKVELPGEVQREPLDPQYITFAHRATLNHFIDYRHEGESMFVGLMGEWYKPATAKQAAEEGAQAYGYRVMAEWDYKNPRVLSTIKGLPKGAVALAADAMPDEPDESGFHVPYTVYGLFVPFEAGILIIYFCPYDRTGMPEFMRICSSLQMSSN